MEEGIVRTKDLSGLAAGLALAVIVGYVNTHTDEMGIVVTCALAGSAILGLIQPRAPWRWGLLIALAFPVGQAVAIVLGLRVPYPNTWNDIPVTALALVPCLAGAYVGSLARRVTDSTGREES
jgi:hypothetical protein